MSYAEAQYVIDEQAKKTGIPPTNMKMIYAQPGDCCAYLKFTEPSDTVIDGQTVCTVKGVTVVMKEGSAPESETDGTVVLTNTDLGAYTDTKYTVEGLTNNTTYYFGFFPFNDYGLHNRSAVNVKAITPQEYILYGFKIDKNDSDPSTRVSYIADCMNADFTPAYMDYSAGEFNYGSWTPDDIWFLADNKPYMVKSDGTPDYELLESDYTLKADGVTASDVSNTSYDGNAMAKIPLVWLYQYEDDDYEYCYICNVQLTEDYHAYAHEREDGTIMDYIWLSCFEGAVSSSKLRSIKGLTPANANTGTTEITYAEANGDLWYTRTWSQRNLINMLLLLMGCSDDSQTTFGNGYYTGGSSSSPNRLTTGYGTDKGRFYGSTASRDVVKVFHIENWWGDMWERIAGCINDNGDLKVKMTPPYNTTGDGYESTGLTPAGTSSGGYINLTNMSSKGRIGYNASGSSSTYTCDGLWFNNSQVDYAIVGGNCNNGLLCGASTLNVNNLVSNSNWNIGAAHSYPIHGTINQRYRCPTPQTVEIPLFRVEIEPNEGMV